MSFQNTKLNPEILAQLYPYQLIESNEKISYTQPIEKSTDTPAYSLLGENRKGIVLVIYNNQNAFLNDIQFQFLTKLLGACQLTLADVAVVNHHTKSIHLSKLAEQINFNSLISFGVAGKELALPFIVPDYQMQAYQQKKFVFAKHLNVYLDDSHNAKLEKSKLWIVLKQLFEIN